MNLKATIAKNYRGGRYKVEIIDENNQERYTPNTIHGFATSFYTDFLWTAKLKAKSQMKKIQKAEEYVPQVYEVSA